MLSASARSRLAVVLVGARNPQNIGAAARAMQDFGFSDLRFVNEYTAPFEAAQLEGVNSAKGASSVMAAARAFPSVADALADVTLVVGTTAIGGRELTREVISVQAATPLLRSKLHAGEAFGAERVALVFGSEKTGLTKDQLSHCQVLVTIPLFAPEGLRHLSMNLGQAVAVCLYELVREGMDGSRPLPVIHRDAANGEDRERLTQLLLDVMQKTGYARRFPANSRVTVVRALAQQLGSTRNEAATWLGILRQAAASARSSKAAE